MVASRTEKANKLKHSRLCECLLGPHSRPIEGRKCGLRAPHFLVVNSEISYMGGEPEGSRAPNRLCPAVLISS